MAAAGELSPVSVVICTHLYARRRQLEEALASVEQQDLPAREIVVVVDGDRRLADYLRARVRSAQLVVMPERSGLSAARNAGASKVTAPLIAFLDDDATADSDWLKRLVDGFTADEVVGVGGWSEPRWEGDRPGWFPEQLLWVVGCSYEGLPLERSIVRNVFGGCACYRKAVFDEVGGFRDDLGRKAKGAQGAEETEFCLRAREGKPEREFVFEPAARIHHLVPRSRASLAYIARRSWHEGQSKALMASLHGGGSLDSERHYVIQQVIRGVMRDLTRFYDRPRERVLHALALVLAVGCAGLGFLVGTLKAGRPKTYLGANEGTRRVAVVAANQFPHIGGIEAHVDEVNSRLARAGWEITSIAADATGLLPPIDTGRGYPVHRHRAYPRQRDWTFSPGIALEVLRGRFDLVHCQGVHTAVPPLAMLAAYVSRTPYVVTFHTGGHSSALRNRSRKTQWMLLGPLLRRAAALIAVCEWEVDLFARELGLPRDAFTVIRNGAEPLRSELTPEERERPDELLILSIGRLERYKGHGRAIAAMPYLLARRPARLVIVGRGPYETSLRSQVDALGLAGSVEFAYFPSTRRSELAALVGSADAAVLLSDYEAHPVAVMEALSVKCPVLVAETSGLTELARAGWVESVRVSAPPTEVADAIERTAASRPPDLALPTWDDCARDVASVYDRALEMRGATSSLLCREPF
jgi:glycosyltransferase involved in cell wall biosynthesis